MEQTQKKKIVKSFLEKGILIGPDFFDQNIDYRKIEPDKSALVLFKDALLFINKKGINWKEFDLSRALFEKGNKSAYFKFIEFLKKDREVKDEKHFKKEVEIIFSFETESKKRDIQAVSYTHLTLPTN